MHDRAGLEQSLDERRAPRIDGVAPQQRAVRRPLALDRSLVLDAERQPLEWARLAPRVPLLKVMFAVPGTAVASVPP